MDGQVASREEAIRQAASAFDRALVGVGVEEDFVHARASVGREQALFGEGDAIVLTKQGHQALAMRGEHIWSHGPSGPGLERVLVEASVGPGWGADAVTGKDKKEAEAIGRGGCWLREGPSGKQKKRGGKRQTGHESQGAGSRQSLPRLLCGVDANGSRVAGKAQEQTMMRSV